ncbi:uncharacterized protein MONOS_168 [Monocercomonoides exilis]|uniref:uncharacterized protein n=1 Tax=Monocercomonoides exilis TaxID=2049356 RepID=UPI0035597D78|nr:hypothetical protein MONOS_168 [Monocercomonoides exilis]|eukprot:MONOS_168.1-p1 / transcript=MONOS_168.1 / gene=MONOS_168 / organism=Monocercomonoides_exilis_PA203 / gene_product=unspecified product / transcript_product=unspecified product / location=Mono_scaffold00003:93721-94369(+) / protein_length=184 / sequence_SO=supercontig / SO=protein_coding / is_pseudo=false
MSLYTLTISPGIPYISSVPSFTRLKLTRATTNSNVQGSSTLYFERESTKFNLCHLDSLNIKACELNLVFDSREEFNIGVDGNIDVTLIGNLVNCDSTSDTEKEVQNEMSQQIIEYLKAKWEHRSRTGEKELPFLDACKYAVNVRFIADQLPEEVQQSLLLPKIPKERRSENIESKIISKRDKC